MDTLIKVYDDIVNDKLAKSIIKKFNSTGKGKFKAKESKGRTILPITPNKPWADIDDELFQCVELVLQKYSSEYPAVKEILRENSMVDSGYYIEKYDKKKGEVSYHIDSNESLSNQIVIVFYLNDIEEGGETEFMYQDTKIKPKRGSAVIFPANFCYVHKENIPQSGSKYIVTTFMIVKPNKD